MARIPEEIIASRSHLLRPTHTLWLALVALLMLVNSACAGPGSASSASGGITLDLPNYWHMSVSLVSSNAKVPDDTMQGGYATPDPGTRFVALQVVATNIQQSDPTGQGSQISATDFSLFLVGNNTQMPRRGDGRSDFPGNSIAPGNTATATFYYETPPQGGTYELDYQLHSIVTGTHALCNIDIPGAS